MNGSIFFWLTTAIVLGIIEASTVNLVTIWFAISALITTVPAAFGVSDAILWVIFVLLSAALVIATRPLAKHILSKKTVPTNADRIISEVGTVTEAIDPLQNTGSIKVMGQLWSAKPENGMPIETGTLVKVKAIEGIKVVVEEVEAKTPQLYHQAD